MKKLRLLLMSLLTLAVLAAPAAASADVNNFTIENFHADETLTRGDPQGQLDIWEHIDVKFTDNNHGIVRALPKTYKHHSLQIKIRSVKREGRDEPYTTYTSNGNLVLKIGDPNRTITGMWEYTIDYTVRNVITFYKDHDELYWDVNGDQWQQPFQQVSATLFMDRSLRLDRQPVCYAGSYGNASQNCLIRTTGNLVDSFTLKPLSANQTLTYVVGFKKGYFHPSKWYETVGEHATGLAGFFVPFLLIGGSGFLYWRKYGRDPKGRGTIIPQYDVPDGLKPLAAGTLLDFKADNRDISATIIDLAVRRYVKIVETKQDRLLRKDKLSYSLELTNADTAALDENEIRLLKALFGDLKPGAATDITSRKNKLYETATATRNAVKRQLADAGYFRLGRGVIRPGKRGTVIVLVIILVVIIDLFAVPVVSYVGAFLGMGLFALCLAFIDARTQKGVDAKEHLLGLKMYLEVAEKQRLEKLQGPDAAYASNAGEPVKTVELFEKLLPYAMVLGVEKQWAEQFKDLYTSPPDWYSGNWSTFNAIYLVNGLNSGIGSAVNTAFAAPSSSDGSGFSGGFSGGGGGGGGGGGW